jgi:hypothetical protein
VKFQLSEEAVKASLEAAAMKDGADSPQDTSTASIFASRPITIIESYQAPPEEIESETQGGVLPLKGQLELSSA